MSAHSKPNRTLSAPLRRAVFLDRDGVINEDTGYPHKESGLIFCKGAPEAISALSQAGFLIVVVTNQSGVGRGYFSLVELLAFHQHMNHRLENEWRTRLDAIYFCPHLPDAGCLCRKPSAHMILSAAEDLGIALSSSYMVGDRDSDVTCGQRAGVRTVGVSGVTHADHIASDLSSAVPWILSQ